TFSGGATTATVTSDASGLVTAPPFTADDVAGTYSVSAAASGGSNPTTSFTLANVALTATTVSSSVNPAVFGQVVTFTASVTASGGTPTGNVLFLDGPTTLGSATLNGAAQATFATSALAAGTHNILAAYAGDANFSGSTSSALTETVSQDVSTT